MEGKLSFDAKECVGYVKGKQQMNFSISSFYDALNFYGAKFAPLRFETQIK